MNHGMTLPGVGYFLRLLATLCFVLFCFVRGSLAAEPVEDFEAMPFDELFFHAQRYATTERKRENKNAAQEELFRRGAPSLDYLMGKMDIENIWTGILAFRLVQQLEARKAAPVLVKYVGSKDDTTRKMAVYYLGFHQTPRLADRILALLDNPDAAGAAIRTLGKWRVTTAVPYIVPFLKHEKERYRVMAANALRDIGSPSAAKHLVMALDDPVFTVRKAAARALSSLDLKTQDELLEAAPEFGPPGKRELIRVLVACGLPGSDSVVRDFLSDTDEGVRQEAQSALHKMNPGKADDWITIESAGN